MVFSWVVVFKNNFFKLYNLIFREWVDFRNKGIFKSNVYISWERWSSYFYFPQKYESVYACKMRFLTELGLRVKEQLNTKFLQCKNLAIHKLSVTIIKEE